MVHIVRTSWLGTSGGPGLTQLAVNQTPTAVTALTPAEAQGAVDAVRGFWDAIKALMPDEIVLTVSPVVDMYDRTSGTLMGTTSAPTAPLSVTGTSGLSYQMAAGAKVNLNTANIIDGRRVRGSIFLVPASSAMYTATGVISSTSRTTVNNAGNAMRAALATAGLDLFVWSRPTSPGPSTDGAISAVSGIETSEKGAILRGRRD